MTFSSERVYRLGLGIDAGADPIGLQTLETCARAAVPGLPSALKIPTMPGGSFDLDAAVAGLKFQYSDIIATMKAPEVGAFLRQQLNDKYGSVAAEAFWAVMGPVYEAGGPAGACAQAAVADGITYGCCAALAVATKNPTLCLTPGFNPAKLACSEVAKVLARYTYGAVVAGVNYACEKVGGGVCDEIAEQYGQLWDSRGGGAVWAAEWALPPVAIYRGVAELKKLFGSCDSPNWNNVANTRIAEQLAVRMGMAESLLNSWAGMRQSLDPPLSIREPVWGDFAALTPPEWKSTRGDAPWPVRTPNGFDCSMTAAQSAVTDSTFYWRNCQRAMILERLDAYARLLGLWSTEPKQLTSRNRSIELVVSPETEPVSCIINTYEWEDCPNDDDLKDFDELVKLAILHHIDIPYQKAYARMIQDFGSAIAAESTGMCVGATPTSACYARVKVTDCGADALFDYQRQMCIARPALTLPLDGQCSTPSRPFLRMTEAGPRCGAAPPVCREGLIGTFPNCQVPSCPSMQRSTTGISPQCLPMNLTAVKMPALRAGASTAPALTSAINSARLASAVSSMAKAPTLKAGVVSGQVIGQANRAQILSKATTLPRMPMFSAKASTLQAEPESKLPVFLLAGAILAILGYVVYGNQPRPKGRSLRRKPTWDT
jgi:hypothetical protein